MKEHKPVDITVHQSEEFLEIEWADGHVSKYPFYGLRKNCPCVMCKGGHSEMSKAADRSLFFKSSDWKWEIKDIKTVGNHALQITWNDGHNQGMYRWDVLRAMCPCEECYPSGYTEADDS
jgi:DUF971 family protein